MARRTNSENEYRLKVNLKGAKRIWHLIAMRGDQTLGDLHEAIFVAFDRFDSHLYSFYFTKEPRRRSAAGPTPREYATPFMFEEPDPVGTQRRFNAARTCLDTLGLRVGQQFEYLFDFGDSWWHEVKVEHVGPVVSGRRHNTATPRRERLLGMKFKRQSPLKKKARRGFRGYPVATVAFYGPDDRHATKVAVGIVAADGAEASALERWLSTDSDVRTDPAIGLEILNFIQAQGVKSVVMADRIIGCPHEEGTDYPDGQVCPKCPFWARRDRWSGNVLH